MKGLPAFALQIGLIAFASAALAQQPAAYTQVTRYDDRGRVIGTLAPDPDGAGPLGYPASRNTYGPENTATSGLLVKVERGQFTSWPNLAAAQPDWSGFSAHLTTLIEYDDHGHKSKETVLGTDLNAESLVQYSYDDWDRVRCKAVRMNKAAYDALPSDGCEPGTGPFGPDRITRYTYDDLGQVIVEERAVGTSKQQFYVTNTYDVTNKRLLTTQTDANGNRTALRYNGNFRLEKRVYPSPTSPGAVNESDFNRYEYDANGNVIVEHKRDGRTIAFTYDANNRPIYKNLSDNAHSGDIAYDYDLRGLARATCFGSSALDDACAASGQGETNTFDGFGNLTQRTSRMAGESRILSYSHDLEGNRTRITHPDGYFFQYGFDGLNRINALRESTAAIPTASTTSLLTVGYLPTGGRGNINRTGGATTTIDPDNALRLEWFTQTFANSANNLTNAFQYNPASQVTTFSQSNTLYTYSEFKSRVGVYVPNGLNQYTNVDELPIGHDANGNLTTDPGSSTTFTYDMENHLVAMSGTVDGQAVTASLVYDVLGRLAQTTINAGTSVTTQLHYDGDALIGEYVGSMLTKRYVHGDQVDEPLVQYSTNVVSAATRRFLHADHQGSIIAHSNETGTAVQTNSYDAYGIPASTNDGRFGYTGQTWLRQLGLNYYKARVYSPRLGRFLQTDPIFYVAGMNMYAYVSGDPANRSDPSGLTDYNCSGGLGTGNCQGSSSVRAGDTIKVNGTTYKISGTSAVSISYTANTATSCGAPQTVSRIGSPGASAQNGEPSSGSGSNSSAASDVSTLASHTANAGTVLQAGVPKGMRFGENGRVYGPEKPFYGNRYTQTFDATRMGRAMGGLGTLGVAVAADSYRLGSGEISGAKYSVNTAIGVMSLLHPFFAGVALGYAVSDAASSQPAVPDVPSWPTMNDITW
jgi:RHS repeat-associated protein